MASATGTILGGMAGSCLPLISISAASRAGEIDGLLKPGDGRRGLDGNPADDGLAGGDAAQDAAGVVALKIDLAVSHEQGVVHLAAPRACALPACADLHRFYSADAHQGLCQVSVQFVEDRLAQTRQARPLPRLSRQCRPGCRPPRGRLSRRSIILSAAARSGQRTGLDSARARSSPRSVNRSRPLFRPAPPHKPRPQFQRPGKVSWRRPRQQRGPLSPGRRPGPRPGDHAGRISSGRHSQHALGRGLSRRRS